MFVFFSRKEIFFNYTKFKISLEIFRNLLESLRGTEGLFGRETLYRREAKTAYKDRFRKNMMKYLIYIVLFR